MELTDKAKRDILNCVIGIIADISDKEYQRRIWIRGEGPECDSFDDAVCDFMPNAEGIIENYKDFGITDSQYQVLKTFRDEFKVFSGENDYPEKFIDTPEWEKIAGMATEVLKAFNYQRVK